jgi:hypothetical protein
MADIKQLVSPFKLMPSASGGGKWQIKQMPRQAPLCNCDSDEENDFGMAPECAFVCNWFARAYSHKTSKKRNPKKPDSLKKTKRHNKNMS